MIRVIFLTTLLWFLGTGSAASPTAGMVTLQIPPEVRVYAGEAGEISISVTIEEGFHVQANPVLDEFLIPTTVEIKSAPGIIPGNPVYPHGKSFTLQDTPDTLWVYDGTFSIKLPVETPPGAPSATYTLEGEFHYQACDLARCFAPRSISFTVPVEVVEK